MVAFSRCSISERTSRPGLFRAAEHCRMVLSPSSRDAQSAGAVGNADLMAASARVSIVCAAAGVASVTRRRAIAVLRIARPSALQAGSGDLAALRLLGEERDQRDADIGAELKLGTAH